MRKSVTKIVKATVAFAMAIGAGVGATISSPKASPVVAAEQSVTFNLTGSTNRTTISTSLIKYVSNNVSFSIIKGTGTNVNNYCPGGSTNNTTQTRIYSNNSVKFEAPTGKVITKVDITATGSTYFGGLDTASNYSPAASCSTNSLTTTATFATAVQAQEVTAATTATGRLTAVKIYYDDPSAEATLAVDKSSVKVAVGYDSTFTVTALNLTSNFSVTGGNGSYFTTSYTPSSSDGDHVVTLHGVSATDSPITLTISSTGATSRTVDVSVEEPVLYEKVAAASSIKAGKQIVIGNTDGTRVLGKYISGNNSPALVNVPNGNGELVSTYLPADIALLTIGGESGAWTLTDQNNKKYYGTADDNKLQASTSATDTWSISITPAGVATITSAASSRVIKKNSASDLFNTYQSGQDDVSIYMVPSSDPEIEVIVTGQTSLGVGETTTLSANKLHGATGTVNWATSNSSILSLNTSSGDEVIVTAGSTLGTATITASLAGCESVVTTFNVRKGSVAVPYTITEAKAAVDGSDSLAKTNVCVEGIVSQVDSYDSTSHSVTYWISSDGTTADQFQVYKGLGLGGAEFDSKDDVRVGAAVIVRGNIKKYNAIYEFEKDNVLVSYLFVTRYDITFDSKLGSAVPTQKVAEGEKVKIPTDPTRESDSENNYSFVCWCSDSTCTQPYDFNTSVTSSFTLYAKWNATPVPAKDVVERDLETNTSLTYRYSKEGEATVDSLTNSTTGVSGTSYTDWSYDSLSTGASYLGKSAGSNSTIQLNNNDKKPGIVTTVSGGNVSKVSVAWYNGTALDRTINIYGKNTAYESVTDLYDNAKKGTLLGSIVCGTSTTLEIEDDYAYIAICSTGALYLDSIDIKWGEETFEYTNTAIKFGGSITTTLWNRLDSESHGILGYGVMLAEPSYLADDLKVASIQEGYDLTEDIVGSVDAAREERNGTYYVSGTNIKYFYNPVSTTPTLSNGNYVWNLVKKVNGTDAGLTRRYTAVAFIRTTDDGIIFLSETTKSAAQVAAELMAVDPTIDDDLNGSMTNLASKYIAA